MLGVRGGLDLSVRDLRTRIRTDSLLRRSFTQAQRRFTVFALLFDLFGLKYLARGTMKCLVYDVFLDH